MNILHATAIMTLVLAIWTSKGISDTIFSGRTVEFRAGKEIDGVKVRIKNAKDGNKLGSGTTNSSGYYKILIKQDPERINVTYDPPKNSKWEPAGRSRVLRVGPKFELDTAGLTNKESGRRDSAEREQHARNTAGYTRAGGDEKVASESVREAIERFGKDAYLRDAKRVGLLRAFLDAGIKLP